MLHVLYSAYVFLFKNFTEVYNNLNPEIWNRVLAVRPNLYGLRLIKTPLKGVKELTAWNRLERKTNRLLYLMVGV